MADNADLFDRINAVLGGKQKRHRWHVETCPFCAHEGYKFAYWNGGEAGGYRCLVCDTTGFLPSLAAHIRIDTGDWKPLQRRVNPTPEPVARWRTNPAELLRRYREHSDRFRLWANYKPVNRATIERYDFGVGRLPYQDKAGQWRMTRDEFLTLPLYEDGELVALRGRNMGKVGPKWMSATGSRYTLWNLDGVTPGSTVWICENYVDAAWLMQAHPEFVGVAIGGATTWPKGEWAGAGTDFQRCTQPGRWATWLAERRPKHVVVALDNDLVGQATEATRRKLEAIWRTENAGRIKEHPQLAPPQSQGAVIGGELIAAGLSVSLFRWPAHAPAKAGIDWILEQETEKAA